MHMLIKIDFQVDLGVKKGDWVVFRAYSGTRMKMYGQEFRLINDDTVEAVVDDPTGVVRA